MERASIPNIEEPFLVKSVAKKSLPAAPAQLDEKSTVRSLAKGFRILEVFHSGQPDMTLSQIAEKADLDAGTALKLGGGFVTLGGSEIENTVTGKPPVQLKLKDGDARFLMGGFSHTARNLSDQPFRNVTIEFLRNNQHAPAVDYAASPSPAQKVLFIQNGVRVSEILLAPGASIPKHEHATPHLVVAISDLNLRSDIEGKPPAEIHQKSEDIKWIPGGFTHTLTNTGTTEARFVIIEF